MTGTNESSFILHLCTQKEWLAAEKWDYKPASFDEIGFIHCSTTRQLLKVANAYYPGAADLLLLWIDPAKLNAPLKWESADGDRFPHIYGVLNREAVIAVFPFPPGNNKLFSEIPGLSRYG